MERELPFRVVLPEDYAVSKAAHTVLYLLHGLFGSCDNWLELSGLKDYLANRKLIVVLPEGGDNWYTDSATVARNKFESSFLDEFIPAFETRYGVCGIREKRAIAGLSMGGFGAFKFALKRPDLFIFAGSMSGAFEAPGLTEENPGSDWETLGPSIREVFGVGNSPTRIENDLFRIIGEIAPEKRASLPQLYFDCGTNDGFLSVNRRLAIALKLKEIAFDYREIDGGHDWEYWDRQIRLILEKLDKILSAERRHL